MSHVQSSRIPANHWTVMAGEMARAVGQMICEKTVDTHKIPKGVLAGAKEFFSLVSSGISDDLGQDVKASLSTAILALALLRLPDDLAESRLRAFAEFVRKLDEPRPLDRQEIEKCIQLEEFFEKLHLAGSDSLFLQRMGV